MSCVVLTTPQLGPGKGIDMFSRKYDTAPLLEAHGPLHPTLASSPSSARRPPPLFRPTPDNMARYGYVRAIRAFHPSAAALSSSSLGQQPSGRENQLRPKKNVRLLPLNPSPLNCITSSRPGLSIHPIATHSHRTPCARNKVAVPAQLVLAYSHAELYPRPLHL